MLAGVDARRDSTICCDVLQCGRATIDGHCACADQSEPGGATSELIITSRRKDPLILQIKQSKMRKLDGRGMKNARYL